MEVWYIYSGRPHRVETFGDYIFKTFLVERYICFLINNDSVTVWSDEWFGEFCKDGKNESDPTSLLGWFEVALGLGDHGQLGIKWASCLGFRGEQISC